MNNKQKIIISVTGIFIVLLVLLGLTYAYFLTRINGNPNNTSITVTTANLELTYGDGNGVLIASEMLVPGQSVKFNILDKNGEITLDDDNKPIVTESKTFSVTNTGNHDINQYAVIIDNLSISYRNNAVLSDGTIVSAGEATHFKNPNDLQMIITCVNELGEECYGSTSAFPTTNDIILTNSIKEGEKQNYTLTILYLETNKDQSSDMNKTISAKLNIIDPSAAPIIEGKVSNFQSGDYVETNSISRISPIDVNGNYKIIGLELGEHTIALKDKTGNALGSKSIEITRGSTPSINNSVISVTNVSNIITIDIDRNSELYTINDSIEKSVPYKTGTLAHEMLSNIFNGKSDTKFREVPLSIPARETSVVQERTESEEMTIVANPDYYFVYSDKMEFTQEGYTLIEPKISKFSDININEFKYVREIEGTEYNTGERTIAIKDTNQIISVNKDTNQIVYKELRMAPTGESKESTLSTTLDDYGRSYYFRGSINDNYLNFNGMCWRIIRVQGDGSVKIILTSPNGTCSEQNIVVNSAFIGDASYGYDLVDNTYKLDYIDPDVTEYANARTVLNSWFNNQKINTTFLKKGDWCLGNSTDIYNFNYPYNKLDAKPDGGKRYLYESYRNIYRHYPESASLKCSAELFNEDYIGLLTPDEAIYAGMKMGLVGTNYLTQHTQYSTQDDVDWLTFKPAVTHVFRDKVIDQIFFVSSKEGMKLSHAYYPENIRPVLILKPNVNYAGGDGTIDNPYTISAY